MPSLGISTLLTRGPLPSLHQSESHRCGYTTKLLCVAPMSRKACEDMHMPQKASLCSENASACSKPKAHHSHVAEVSGF